MKLFVQIPCLNEEKTLPEVIRDIPRTIKGIDEVKILVIDDGSIDETSKVAYKQGADYVVRLPRTEGLAKAFSHGITECLELGADIIVNTDGDHQYSGDDIPKLVQPILEGRADIVIGDREVTRVKHFSPLKKTLQVLGSFVVSRLSHVEIPDVTSGFRAYSREAALRMNIFSNFSYTLETLIQAGNHRIPVVHVPIKTNEPSRPSRLFSNLWTYLKRSSATILRVYALYEPLRAFFCIGGFIFFIGLLGVTRFLYFYFSGSGAGHIQSLIISGALVAIGFQVWVLGILADLISINRKLSEEILYRMKKNGTSEKNEHLIVSTEALNRTLSSKKARKVG
jgi:glycosyltransferase involved in cell wall biosynthesis